MAAVRGMTAGMSELPVFDDQGATNAIQGAPNPADFMPRQYDDEQIKEAFDTFDLDQNKFIGVAEIKHILAIVGESASDAEIDEMIRMCDADGDGQVTYDEFYKLFYNPLAPPRMGGGPAQDLAQVDPYGAAPPMKPGGMPARPPTLPPTTTPGAGVPAAPPGLAKMTSDAPQRVGSMDPSSVAHNESMDAVMGKFGGGKKLKPAYIKKLYKKFKQVDADGSGTIDYPEFLQVMEEDDHPLMRRMFDLFDVDKSGRLELKEFIVGLSNYTSAAKTDKLKFAFMMFDEDGSGFIERRELVKILQSTFRLDIQPGAEHQEIDFEGRATAILVDLKLPVNGSMSYEKFMELAKTQPNLLYPALRVEKTVPERFSIDAKIKGAGGANAPREGLLQQM